MLSMPCTESSDHGHSSRVVMIATVAGPGTGGAVVDSLLGSMSGYQFGGLAAGSGWVHLSEFAQRWLTMREKMTSVSHPDFIHFSQFIATANDVLESKVKDTDFRPEAELIRRKVKPAWVQYFNMTKVMCGLRRLVMEANGPRMAEKGFGFTHMFEDSGEQEDDPLAPPSRKSYTPARALRSLDWFFHLFPRGRVIIHLPVSSMPSTSKPPRCTCVGAKAACRATDSASHRTRVIEQLLRYHRLRPRRTLLVASSRDFRNLTALTAKIAAFLGERPTTSIAQSRKVLNAWTQRMRHQEILDTQHALQLSTHGAFSLDETSKPLAKARICKRSAGAPSTRCPPYRCSLSTAEASPGHEKRDSCVACPLSLVEWAWSRPVRSFARRRAPHQATDASSRVRDNDLI